MSRFFLGVDGGNTKTHYALFDEFGSLRAFLARGTASHEALGSFDAMEAELHHSVGEILLRANVDRDQLSAAVLGLAGADTDDQHRTISTRLHRLGLQRFRLVNDAFLGIKAGTPSGVGVCSINGTGTVAAAVGPAGTMVQVGGHGFVSGDEGGGGFLSDRVIRAVYDAHYRCGSATKLTDLLLQEHGVSDVDTLFHRWLSRRISVLSASKAAFNAANVGDPVARGILVAMGRNGGETALGAARRAGFREEESIEMVLAGSLYVKADSTLLIDAFRSTVNAGWGRVNYHVLGEPPVAGAVLWALEDDEMLNSGMRRKVLSTDWAAAGA